MLNWLTTARAEDVTVWWPYLKIFIEFWRWGRRERWESSAHCRSCMCIDVTGWLQRNSHSAFHSPIKPHKTASVAGISNTRRTETLHKSCWRDPGEINTWVPCSLGWPANPKLSKLKKQSQTASWKSHKRRSTAEITAWKRCRQCRKRSWDGQMHFVHINRHIFMTPKSSNRKSCPQVLPLCPKRTKLQSFAVVQHFFWGQVAAAAVSTCPSCGCDTTATMCTSWIMLQVTASSLPQQTRLSARVVLSPDKSSA